MESQIPGIILVSHGRLCEGLVQTVGMIYGEVEKLSFLPLEIGQDPADYCEQLDRLISSYGGNVLIMADLMGGTPFKSVMRLGQKWKLAAITGVNVPMIIDAADLRVEIQDPEQLAEAVIKSSGDAIVNITPRLLSYFQKYSQDHT